MNTQIGSTIIDRKHGSNVPPETEISKATETIKPSKGSFSRRSFLGKSLAAGAVTMGAGLLANTLLAKEGNEKEKGHLKKGDAAILRFLAAAEIIEADLWQQYNELAGIQDSEVPGGTGSPAYTAAVQVLDSDMNQYIHDNTDNENPDLGDTFPQAIPGLSKGQFPAIPRNDGDLHPAKHLQAIANTAGFHFGFIEQGGTSLYPSLAQRVDDVEVLRVLFSIGPTEAMHFQTWHDKAGNAPPLTDPTNGLVFPDLNSPPFGGAEFQTNLIMPEPTVFLNRTFPIVSIIRPTETEGAAMGAVKALTADGLFIGQPPAFFTLLNQLAEEADAAK